MTIDNVVGTVDSVDFQLSEPDLEAFTVICFSASRPDSAWEFQTELASSPEDFPALTLFLPTGTLGGYEGGSLCPTTNCSGQSGLTPQGSDGPSSGGEEINLISASAVVSSPEPGTLSLVALALPVFFLLRRKLFRLRGTGDSE